MKNLNDYLDFQSKIIQLLKRNKQTWGLYFFEHHQLNEQLTVITVQKWGYGT